MRRGKAPSVPIMKGKGQAMRNKRFLVGVLALGLCAIGLLGTAIARTQTIQGARTIAITGVAFQAIVDGRDGRVFLPEPGSIQIVDTQQGVTLPPVPLRGAMSPPNIQLDDQQARLFVQTRGPAIGMSAVDTVYMLDTRRGGVLGTLPLARGESVSQLAVDTRTGRVFVFTAARRLYVFDASTGRHIAVVTLWRGDRTPKPAPGTPADTLVIDHRTGMVVVTESDQAVLYALDGTSGRLFWTTGVPAQRGQAGPTLWLPVIDETTGRLVVDDTSTGTVHVLDLRTGHPARYMTQVNPGRVDMVAVQRTGRAFVFYGGHIDVIDTTSGRLVHTTVLGQTYDLEPATVVQGAGRVLVTNYRTQTMDVLDGTSGRIVNTIPLRSPGAPVVDERTGQVLLATRTSGINVLDTRSGRIAPAFQVAASGYMAPWPMLSVDERTGEVIAMTNSAVAPLDRWSWIPARVRSIIPFLPSPTTYTGASLSVLVPAQ